MKLTIVRRPDGSATATVFTESDQVLGQLDFWPGSFPSDADIRQAAHDVMPGVAALETAAVH